MKIDKIKSVLAIALSLVFGLMFEIIAPEIGVRNWISFGVGSITLVLTLLPALGFIYEDTNRGVLIKLFSWIMFVIILILNLIFACIKYNIKLYVTLSLLLIIIGLLGIHTLSSSKKGK